jgi:uncharacterized protein YdaU (DUF1376 family)
LKRGKLLAEWFWTDRWSGSSAALLPMETRGVYREMLSEAWRRGGRLPNDHDAIRRAIRCTEDEWSRAWPKVRRYWREDGDDLVNDTQLEVYAEASAQAAASRSRAERAAASRWSPTNAQASRQALPQQSPPSPDSVSGLRLRTPSPDDGLTEGRSAVVSLTQQAGRQAGERKAPANPLVDRRAYEAEFLALVRELARVTDRDPVEVAREASSYEGARTSPLNPASMTDDRLANSVLDLRANLQAAKAKADRQARGIREAQR